jgi:hypothetical protein
MDLERVVDAIAALADLAVGVGEDLDVSARWR